MKLLYNLLMMSISGSLMFTLSAIVHRQLRQKYARWYYALLVTAAAMFIVPIQALFTPHKFFRITVPRTSAIVSGGTVIRSAAQNGTGFSLAALILMIWAAISFILLTVTAYRYFKTARALHRISEECYDSEALEVFLTVCRNMRISRVIEVRSSAHLQSPLLFGILRPVVVIPKKAFSDKELIMIFTHELTHYKHHDLMVKLAMSLARCVHFFNPAVYLLSKSINEGCELCCDEAVLDRLSLPDKKDYGRLIISVIESDDKTLAYSTAMASPKDKIQKRLLRIIEFRKPSALLRTASVMLAISISLCSLTALGFEAAKEALPEEVTQTITRTLTGGAASPFADILSAASAAETPQSTETAEITPEPESASEELPVEMEALPEAAAMEEPHDAEDPTAQDADFSYSFDIAEDEEPSPAAEPAPQTAETVKTIEMPGTSYMFNPVFTDGITAVRSENIHAVNEMLLNISRSGGNAGCYVKIYKVKDFEEDEIVYDETQVSTEGYNLNVRLTKGETYYIVAQQNNGAERDSLYVNAR